MIRLNIHEAKTHLSRYLERVEKGEVIEICRRNVPIAELRPIAPRSAEPRPLGLSAGSCEMAADFDELPAELVDGFEGQGR